MSVTFLVLESPWSDDMKDGLSVRPFFEGLHHIAPNGVKVFAKPFQHRHDLSFWIERLTQKQHGVTKRVVYIAAHGTDGRIGGLPGKSAVNFQTLAKTLRLTGKIIEGVHLGSCSVGTPQNARNLLSRWRKGKSGPFRSPPCKWVAGYDKPVDWLDSTLIDVQFWRHYWKIGDEWEAAKKVCEIHPIAKALGFRVYRFRYNQFRDSSVDP